MDHRGPGSCLLRGTCKTVQRMCDVWRDALQTVRHKRDVRDRSANTSPKTNNTSNLEALNLNYLPPSNSIPKIQ